jgi:uncharacterized protein (UPF0332 family)
MIIEDGFLSKAKENLAVAEWCLKEGHFNACINRVYYSMYQVAFVALVHFQIAKSEAQHSHKWIQSTFASELVGKRKIFPGYQSHLMRVQEKRNLADYSKTPISRKQAKRTFDFAKNFIKAVMGVINES